ncbi:MAG: tRNA pseudouridine(38-40) synthase TruA [Thermoleophilia bacterium]|nr:tRNA pseudouridine(38-40) synthase TruA [Thermoleophilia bacterium]
MAYRLDLQYDGSDFHGWAKQPGLETVEGALETAFTILLRETPRLTVAGRTDTGVHARRQVVSLELPRGLGVAPLVRSLNSLTPPGLAVTGLCPMPGGFDARRDALARSYRYFIWRGAAADPFRRRFVWHVPGEIDFARLQAAAALVPGRHDFKAFTPTETEHILFARTVHACRWRCRGPLVWLEIEAQSFLRHMVRSLVGTMVEIAAGRSEPGSMAWLLEGAAREAAGPTAPPHGLFLWRIRYPAERGSGAA